MKAPWEVNPSTVPSTSVPRGWSAMNVMNGRGSLTASGAGPSPLARPRRLLRLLEHLALGLVDPVSEGRVDDHDDLVVRSLGVEGPDRLVELGQAGRVAALGGQVRPVDHHTAAWVRARCASG